MSTEYVPLAAVVSLVEELHPNWWMIADEDEAAVDAAKDWLLGKLAGLSAARAEGEAAVVESAVEWVEAIRDHPNVWAGSEEKALILAVQGLTGDSRWPELRDGE